MAKDKNNPVDEQPQEQEQVTAPGNSVAGNDFPKTLTAATREDLFEQVEALKASVKDVTLSAGAVACNEQGQYIIQIDIIK